jgi:hypothetical protein
LQTITEIVRKYAPEDKKLVAKEEAINAIGAWRLLQNIKQSISEDSRGLGLPEVHNFDEKEKEGCPDSDIKGRDMLSRLLLRTNGKKLFGGFIQLLHGVIGCVELVSMA